LAGPETALHRLTARLEREVIDHHLLRTSHAFHSWMMDPALPGFTDTMARHPGQTPKIPYASGVTGGWMRAEDVTAPDYFSRLLRGTVRFSAGLRTLASLGPAILLEVGPGRSLGTLARKHPELENHVVLACLRQQREERHDRELLLRALGGLWLHGVRIDWQALHAGERRHRVPLPGYPFQRREHWAVPTSNNSRDFGVDTRSKPAAAAPPRSLTERDRIAEAPADDRKAHIARYLGRTINALLGHPPSRPVEKDRPLKDLGVDSLLSIQVQARITAELRVEVAIRDLLARTIVNLADRISEDFESRAIASR